MGSSVESTGSEAGCRVAPQFVLGCFLFSCPVSCVVVMRPWHLTTGGIELHEVGNEGPFKRAWRPQKLEALGAGDSPWLMNSQGTW